MGKYRTINITLGTGADYTYTATPGGANNNWRFIESGTAFMYPANANQLISFTEGAKSAGAPPSSMLRTATLAGKETQLAINLYTINADNTNTLSDGIREVFDNSYSTAIDKDDAKKITGFDVNLGIASNNEILAVEKRPLPSANDVINLKLWNTAPGNYQFEIEAANFTTTESVFIKDNYLNTYSPVDLKNNTILNFNITGDALSSAANRFSIVFAKPALINYSPSIVIYPNPIQNGLINLQMNNLHKGSYIVKLINNLGQTMLTKQINHAEGTSTEIIDANKLKGAYIFELSNPDKSKTHNKLIIN